MAVDLPCGRERCVGVDCGHFNDPTSKFGKPHLKRGCMGWEAAPWGWGRWYLNELPKMFDAKYGNKEQVK